MVWARQKKLRLPGCHRWDFFGTRAFWISSRHTAQLRSLFLIPGWGQEAGGFSGEGRKKSGRVVRVRMPLRHSLDGSFSGGLCQMTLPSMVRGLVSKESAHLSGGFWPQPKKDVVVSMWPLPELWSLGKDNVHPHHSTISSFPQQQ